MRTFGERLTAMMHIKDVNYIQLARSIGKAPASISRYMRDEAMPAVGTVVDIADVLGCATDELLTDKFVICKYCKYYLADDKSARNYCGLWESYKFRPVRKATDYCSRGRRVYERRS